MGTKSDAINGWLNIKQTNVEKERTSDKWTDAEIQETREEIQQDFQGTSWNRKIFACFCLVSGTDVAVTTNEGESKMEAQQVFRKPIQRHT